MRLPRYLVNMLFKAIPEDQYFVSRPTLSSMSCESKKRAFTLIEVLIGFAIASIIFGVLFTALYESSVVSSRLDQAEQDILGRAELQQRLNQVFAQIDEESSFFLEQKEDAPDSLHFTYQCGIDPDPHFSNQVIAQLACINHTLLFTVHPNLHGKEESLPRNEILKKGVKGIEYEFLKEGEVTNQWPKENKFPPQYLKLTLTLEDEQSESYAFWMSHDIEGVILE